MQHQVETLTPEGVMTPLGPYSHIARHGNFIMISATAGIDPATNQLAGPDVAAQTAQILDSFELMLDSVGAGLEDVMHINVFLVDMGDFTDMNRAYAERMGTLRPARTAIGVTALPKPGARITMNLTAVAGTASQSSPGRRP